ncbi:hsp12 variant C [Helicobacter pylori Hp P-3]|nr:hsp12 variant C [Helicobacter pylori Hp P-3]EJC55922.1 hsp12 variant C [Helicobacter pylori Hp P-3b]
MLGSVKKAVFRVLCLGALCLCGGLMAEQDPKELIFSGITIYTDIIRIKISLELRNILKKLANQTMLKNART